MQFAAAAAAATTVEAAHALARRPVSAQFSVPGAVDHHAGRVIRSVLNEWGSVDLRSEAHSVLTAAGLRHDAIGVDRETNFALLARVAATDAAADLPVVYIGGTQAISGGIYDHHLINHGALGLAGEIGHMIIDPGGRPCWCGRRGCVETRIGLLALYAAATGHPEPPFDQLFTDSADLLTAIRDLASTGDERAHSALPGPATGRASLSMQSRRS
ncbi:ROK family protein [Rhodococcus sp. NPDC056960]|uniref:ROK family protein n=1 Tax=Rhodococcus sp. NPDC056960 TaxID=3345982 RepID=UPI003634359A